MYRNRRAALAVSIVLLISILLPSDLIAGVFSPNSSRCNINREIGDGQAIVNLFDNHRDPGCLTSEKQNSFSVRPSQTLKNTVRLSFILILMLTFFFGFVRKRVLFSYIYLYEFPIARFLRDLNIRLEKDGKKRALLCC